ncbi:MAG: hypothetical protein AAFR66_19240, partial [Bacteroidota bacterium]
ENLCILYDSVNYFQGAYTFEISSDSDSVTASSNRSATPIKIQKDSLPYFSTLEALELYLKYEPLHVNFDQLVSFGISPTNDAFRTFKLKVIGELTVADDQKSRDCFRVALISLDSANVMDSRLLIDKETGETIEKEYIVIEYSKPVGGLKSIGYERHIPWDYVIDIDAIKEPSAGNYLEASISLWEKGGEKEEVLRLIQKAFELEPSISPVMAKLDMLTRLEEQSKIPAFIDQVLAKTSIPGFSLNQIGQYLLRIELFDSAHKIFTAAIDRNPESFIPLVGIARYYSAIGDFSTARTYLEKSLKFEVDEKNRINIEMNIERLAQNTPMQ